MRFSEREFHVWVDTLLAVSVAAVSVFFTAAPGLAVSLAGLVLSASLAIRRSHPALALAVGMSAAAAHALLSTGPPVSAVVVPILVYSLARPRCRASSCPWIWPGGRSIRTGCPW